MSINIDFATFEISWITTLFLILGSSEKSAGLRVTGSIKATIVFFLLAVRSSHKLQLCMSW